MQLTRSRVIATAMALMEAEGAQAVSMTRLATELGCGLVALYSHVPSTHALLDGVAGAIAAGIEVTETPGSDWTDQLRAQVHAARRATSAHPRCTIAVAGRVPATAASLRPAELAAGTLRAGGIGGPDVLRIVRALAAYLVGSLVLDVGVAPSLRGPDPDGADSARPVLRAASFPHLIALAAESAGVGPDVGPGACGDAGFEFGLELLLRGVADLSGCAG